MKTWLTTFLLLCAYLPIVQGQTLSNTQWESHGAHIVFHQAMEVPMLTIHIAFKAGSAYDGKQFGLSALTTALLNQGTKHLDATQIAEKFANIGAQYNNDTTPDMAILQLKTLTTPTALPQAVDLFTAIAAQPDFKMEAFLHKKNQQLMTITQEQESPNSVANQLFFEKLYQAHPYAHPVNGSLTSVKAITRNDVQQFYKHYFTANNAVIVLVGALSVQQAHQIADQLTLPLAQGQPAPDLPTPIPLATSETLTLPFPSSQTMIRLGQIGIKYDDPRYFALQVGNYILGGGTLVSRLSEEVREKRGLTYGVVSQLIPMLSQGPFLISLSTKNKEAQNALKLTQDVLSLYLKEGPSEEELTAAKKYLIGSFPLSWSSNSAIASMLLKIAFYHLPEDFLDTYTVRVASVSKDDIKKAFDELINLQTMLVVSVGT